jgi:hypothetical protein
MVTRRLPATLLVLAMTACGGSAASVSESEPTPSPTEEPSPSPSFDVAQAFAVRMLATRTVSSDITGTATLNNLPFIDITGSLESNGADYHVQMAMAILGTEPTETESILVGSTSYELSNGLWIQSTVDASTPSVTDAMSAAFDEGATYTLAGTETVDGVTLHRLEITPAPEIGPEMLGLTDPSITSAEGSLVFLAEDDGTPGGMILTATWVQDTPSGPVDATFELTFRFDPTVTEVAISAPDDAWERYTSAEFGYQMAHPVGWTAEHVPGDADFSAYDDYLDAAGSEVQVYHYSVDPGVTAADWNLESANLLQQDFGVAPDVTNNLTLPSGPAVQILALNATVDGTDLFFQEAVIFGDGVAWDVDWYSEAGNEAADQARFVQFVNSFQPTS